MGTKRRVLYLALILATLGVLAWLVLQPREPRYQGRPLSYWLGLGVHTLPDQPMPEQSQEAMRHIGTNAIPPLLRLIAATDSPLKLKLIVLAQKQHIVQVNFTSAKEKNFVAGAGFVMLGSDAAPAAPALAEIFNRNVSPESQRAIISTFETIGPAAKETIPVLLRGAASKDMQSRLLALRALGNLNIEPEKVVPELTKYLTDPNVAIQIWAATGLGKFGPAARSAAPALEQLANSPMAARTTAMAARRALAQIDPEAAMKPVIK